MITDLLSERLKYRPNEDRQFLPAFFVKAYLNTGYALLIGFS
jgi:hypothetical protein